MLDIILQNKTLLIGIGIMSVVTFLGSLIIIPILIINMDDDYFETKKKDTEDRSKAFNFFAIIIIVVKNILGILFVLAGVLMLVLPGQGIVTILIGISIANFPGKRKLELKLIRLTAIHNAINWIRAKAKKPPIIIPEE